jgi:hypothetical protein
LVVTFVVDSGGVKYTSPSIGAAYTVTEANTYNSVSGTSNPNEYELVYEQDTASGTFTQSYFNLKGGSGSAAPFTSSGLPVLANATSPTGELWSATSGTVTGTLNYTLTSLTPVPLPGDAWLLVGGLGLWWVLTGSNRRHSPCKGDALPAELSTR